MSIAKKTFVIFSPGFPKDKADSACLPFPKSFAVTLKKLNPSLHVVVFAFQYPFTDIPYELEGLNVIPFNGRNKGKLNRLLVWKKVLSAFNKIKKDGEITGVLNLWLGECALLGNYAAKKAGVRSLTWLMGQDAKKDNTYFSFIKQKPENFIALSDFIAEEFYRNYKLMPAHIIPPGIAPEEFSTEMPVRNIDIIGVGSLITLKQYDVFINVIASVRDKCPSVKAVICGDGPEKKNLLSLIKEKGLSNNISLSGEVDHSEVLKLMQRSKILLHTSTYEGFGVVYAEALYAGAHTVGFCQPMKDAFKHMHTVKDEKAMISTVKELLANPDLQHEKLLVYPIEEICRKISALYD